MNDLCLRGAFELAALIRAKEVSPLEVVQAHVDQARRVNPSLNAIVEERYEAALAEAREKTENLHRLGEVPPLYGVPCTVKEMLSVQGMKRTAGNIHRRDSVMNKDASIVKRVRDAGAVILGTTNVPELGFWFETHNVVYGRTNNPYDLERTAGGSSGGEGSIVGAGASPFGLGSDIGGSIRIPASFCGVFGHKPTNRTLPLTGHFPYSTNEIRELKGGLYPFTSVGPLARRAKDLRPLMQLMAGPDGIDPETVKTHFDAKTVEWKGRRVFFADNPRIHLTRGTDDNMGRAVRTTARLFEQWGCRVEELDPKFFLRTVSMWGKAVKSTKKHTYEEALYPGGEISVWDEILRALRGQPNYTVPSLGTLLLEKMIGRHLSDGTEILGALEELRQKLNLLLGADALLIFPAHPRPAPKHSAPFFSPFDFVYTGIFNVLGNPACAAPTGLDPQGLPVGVQLVAGPFQDHLCWAAAEALEETFGGWQPPAGLG